MTVSLYSHVSMKCHILSIYLQQVQKFNSLEVVCLHQLHMTASWCFPC